MVNLKKIFKRSKEIKNVEGIRIIQHVLPHTVQELEIVPIGDVHIGDSHVDIKALMNVVNYVLAKENRYVILNGDLMNMALKTSVSDVYGEILSPMEQIKKVHNIMLPIKDRILAIGSGNHEDRTYITAGLDMSYMLALELGIKEYYSSNSFVIFLKVGQSENSRPSIIKQQVYSIFVQHGRGGGRKMGAKVSRLVDMDEIIANADLYIMGHVHTPVMLPQATFISDEQNMTLKRHTAYYMIHNAFLDFGGYGLTYGFRPTAKNMSYAKLYTQGKKTIDLVMKG
jgi:predicted phosphodiesterase